MATEIWRDFDPNLEIPIGLKNARVLVRPVIEEFLDDSDDFDESPDDPLADDELDAPTGFVVVSQTLRTASDGSKVIDVVIDVEDVEAAMDYQYRIATI